MVTVVAVLLEWLVDKIGRVSPGIDATLADRIESNDLFSQHVLAAKLTIRNRELLHRVIAEVQKYYYFLTRFEKTSKKLSITI